MTIYRHAKFNKSAAKLSQLLPDEGLEVAFAGRSNAGKSSAINTITDHKGLAKTSKTPGRTQLINFFDLDEDRRLVDLPGYGYAKVSEQIKLRWQQTLAAYLENRQCLRGLIIVMDIRHPLKDYDRQMLFWAHDCDIPVHLLLTKADKLSRNQSQKSLLEVKKYLKLEGITATVQCFSALKKQGIEEARNQLDQWLNPQ